MDAAALREKYLAERDKRIRPDGNDQYIEPTGRYAHYLDDPYVEPAAASSRWSTRSNSSSSEAASPA